MIKIVDKSKCCGCTACYSICPEKSISMERDSEGFDYPLVDKNKCIECGACERVCPFNYLNGQEQNNTLFAAVQHKKENERFSSTAGGAFSLIADYILDNGGIVYAVGYEDMVVCHKKCINKDALHELRGSKYVQSSLNDVFEEIKLLLKQKQVVLFVGTPCQVHGLKNLVGNNEFLYTIDLLCLGVTSPGLFKKWIEYLNEKYKSKVTFVHFRDKSYGYSVPNVRVDLKNGKKLEQIYDAKVHANLFFKHFYNVRPSCYECEFREIPRVSDFTIGDFVNIGEYSKEMDDDQGTTRMWIHTEKGREIFDAISDQMVCKIIEENKSNILGGSKKQIIKPNDRELFFNDSICMDYKDLIKKYEPNSFRSKCVNIVRRIINCLPSTVSKRISKIIRMKQAHRSDERVKMVSNN